MSNHKTDLTKHLEAKPLNKKTFIFKASDVYPPMRKGHHLGANEVNKRKSLGTWLRHHMKPTTLIQGFEISIYSSVIPYRYLATRVQGGD